MQSSTSFAVKQPMRSNIDARAVKPRALTHTRTLRSLYSQEQTDHAIHRERCRADRNGQEFSLVMFRLPRNIGPSRTALRLARAVLNRARTTDEIGWFDEETVCALLPDTHADGAHRFVHNVLVSLRDPAIRPEIAVYTYPSDWYIEGVTDSVGRPLPAHAHHSTERTAATAEMLQRHDLVPFVIQGVKDEMGTAEVPLAAPLELLFAQPMPWWKRTMDIIGASIGLLLAAPFLLAIAAGIKLTSRGPVLFRQRRSGLGGRVFSILKFRTMVVDAEAKKAQLRSISEQDGPAFKLANDPRVTRIGQILRKTSLDELPQFWNVLMGDMSLVGPRPLPVDEQNGVEQWQRTRLEVTPGLTCIWQVKGRSQVSFADWVRMDVNYIRNRTFMHDLKILFLTVPAVLLRRGAR